MNRETFENIINALFVSDEYYNFLKKHTTPECFGKYLNGSVQEAWEIYQAAIASQEPSLSFDFSSIPDDATIDSATLTKRDGTKIKFIPEADLDKANAEIARLREALVLAKSVCNSINKSSHHEIKIHGERNYLQTEEWVAWASGEVLDIITKELAQGEQNEN
jgi:hypothetical protein